MSIPTLYSKDFRNNLYLKTSRTLIKTYEFIENYHDMTIFSLHLFNPFIFCDNEEWEQNIVTLRCSRSFS